MNRPNSANRIDSRLRLSPLAVCCCLIVLLVSMVSCGGGTSGTGVRSYSGVLRDLQGNGLPGVRIAIDDGGDITDQAGSFNVTASVIDAEAALVVELNGQLLFVVDGT